MCDKCNCAGKGLAAFLLGAVVGVAAGVLFAPAKGETTRRKLKRWADDTYEDQKEFLTEQAEEFKTRLSEHAQNAKEHLAKEFNKRKDELAAKFKKEEKED